MRGRRFFKRQVSSSFVNLTKTSCPAPSRHQAGTIRLSKSTRSSAKQPAMTVETSSGS